MRGLVGRDRELLAVRDAFASGAPIVTLLGPPGMGKTRLAERLVELELERGARAQFCDVSEARTEAALLHAIAACVAPAHEGGSALAVEDLAARLVGFGALLLVLDNFEQVVVAAPLVVELVRLAPELRILVTSRERLAVQGETAIELGPLSSVEAARLFRERAAEVGGAVGGSAAVIDTLVTRLDGIPLALELAAARTRVMTPEQLAARLDERFALLRRSRSDGEKHAALESAIGGSWELLDASEQRALAELSVFAGSFTLEAAEAVLAREIDPMQRIPALRDKSLVHMASPGRLALFVSIREYAAARLDELGEARKREALSRHARFFAARAKELNVSRLFQGTSPDSELRRRLLEDRDNLLAALAFARTAEPREPAVFAELAGGVTQLYLAPGATCLELMNEALDVEVDSSRRLRLLLARQGLHSSLGMFDASQRDLATVLATKDLPAPLRALALNTQGIQERFQSRYRAAWTSHVLAESALESLDLPRLAAINTACMGRLQCDFGDENLGRKYNERARAICVDIGDRWLEALVLGNLGQLEQEHGNFDVAREMLALAVERFREASEPLYLGVYLGVLGDLCFEAEAIDEARRAYEEAGTFFARWRAHRQGAALYAAWGALEARHGDLAAAETRFAQARRIADRCDSPTVRLLLELHEAALRLRRAAPAALESERAKWITRRDALARGIGDPNASGELEIVACSIDVRFALRMLSQALAAHEASPSAALLVAADGAWFQLRGGAKVDLLRRGPLRRLLAALAAGHSTSRGVALAPAALVDEAWPGERVLESAAATRLRVAIATLRKMGLKPYLRTGPSGYLLDPEAQVERVGFNKD